MPDELSFDTGHLILAERRRQIATEGYDWAHDDAHHEGDLIYAALAYLCTPGDVFWPWEPGSFKPSADPIRNIVKAGALLAAEGDRLKRRSIQGLPVVGGLVVLGIGPDENVAVVDGLQRIAAEVQGLRDSGE